MPLSADPGQLANFTYEAFDESKVTLKARFITSRERTKHSSLVDQLVGKSFDDETILPIVREAIELGIVGTTFDELSDRVTRRDLVAIARAWPSAVSIAEHELGESKSRPRLTVVPAAATVTEAVKTPTL